MPGDLDAPDRDMATDQKFYYKATAIHGGSKDPPTSLNI